MVHLFIYSLSLFDSHQPLSCTKTHIRTHTLTHSLTHTHTHTHSAALNLPALYSFAVPHSVHSRSLGLIPEHFIKIFSF